MAMVLLKDAAGGWLRTDGRRRSSIRHPPEGLLPGADLAGGRPLDSPSHPLLEHGVGDGGGVVAEGVVVDEALTVSVHPDDRLVLAGPTGEIRVGVGGGEDDVPLHHFRVLV